MREELGRKQKLEPSFPIPTQYVPEETDDIMKNISWNRV
jgi:hypothetical protein